MYNMAADIDQEQTPSRSSVFCVACGELTKGTNRKSLLGEKTEHVIRVWKEVFSAVVEDYNFDINQDDIFDSSTSKMCRKCFAAMDKYYSLRESLCTNMARAVNVVPSARQSKSRRLSQQPSLPSASNTKVKGHHQRLL